MPTIISIFIYDTCFSFKFTYSNFQGWFYYLIVKIIFKRLNLFHKQNLIELYNAIQEGVASKMKEDIFVFTKENDIFFLLKVEQIG